MATVARAATTAAERRAAGPVTLPLYRTSCHIPSASAAGTGSLKPRPSRGPRITTDARSTEPLEVLLRDEGRRRRHVPRRERRDPRFPRAERRREDDDDADDHRLPAAHGGSGLPRRRRHGVP